MIPSPVKVRQIFNDTYNVFYKKWCNTNTVYNPDLMLHEARELNWKYDCDLCRHITADLIICIENERRMQGDE